MAYWRIVLYPLTASVSSAGEASGGRAPWEVVFAGTRDALPVLYLEERAAFLILIPLQV